MASSTTIMVSSSSSRPALVVVALVVLLVGTATEVRGDVASDKAQCTNQLITLSTCLPYVGKSSNVPTPDCCTGLKQVVASSLKCLCLLIKDRNDPSLGLNIDLDRALSLPSKCSAPGDASLCPKLLNLSPNSPDAQIFKQIGNATHATPSTTSGNATGVSNTGPSSTSGASGRSFNYYRGGKMWWLGVEMVGGFWIYCIAASVLVIIQLI